MRLPKGEKVAVVPTVKVELELEVDVKNKLIEMEKHTKILCSELANIALKRFISQHKDYFPVA